MLCNVLFFVLAFCLTAFSFAFGQEKIDTVKTVKSLQPQSPQATGDNIKFKNSSGSAIITFTDEGSNKGSITLPSMTSDPSITTNKLYNVSGTLKFNGSAVGSGSGVNEINDLDDGRTYLSSVYLGQNAGSSGTGNANTVLGTEAMNSHNTGDVNTAVGYRALYNNTTGTGNVVLGNKAGYYETGSNKLYIENSSSSSPLIWGDFSSDSVKINGGLDVTSAISTPHLQVTYSPTGISPGDILVASDANGNLEWQKPVDEIGAESIDDLTDGKYKTADGGLFLGENAGFNDVVGTEPKHNVGVGKGALYSNTTGARNVVVGFEANYFNEKGTNNTIVGYRAGKGSSLHNKSGNVFIGYQAGSAETGSNKLYIENSASTAPLIWGDFSLDIAAINGDFGVGTQNPSDKVHIVAASGQDAFRIQIGGATKFRVFSNGGTSIGTNNTSGTPTNGLYVHGDIKNQGGVLHTSDRRFKKNIIKIENALEKLREVNGVYYNWKTEEYPERNFTEKKQIGVIAQEVEKVFPELVNTDSEGYKSVNYSKFTSVLIEAIKEQDERIRTQNERIKKLEEENNELKVVINKNKNFQEEIKVVKSALMKLIEKDHDIKFSNN